MKKVEGRHCERACERGNPLKPQNQIKHSQPILRSGLFDVKITLLKYSNWNYVLVENESPHLILYSAGIMRTYAKNNQKSINFTEGDIS